MTPFQGFDPGYIAISPLFELLVTLPANISELTEEPIDRWARRREGLGGWAWRCVTLDTAISEGAPIPIRPFSVIFTADDKDADRVAAWNEPLAIKALHVGLGHRDGMLTAAELTCSQLQQHCKSVLEQAKQIEPKLEIKSAYQAIDNWKINKARLCSLRLHSHTVTKPNEMVLKSAGEDPPADENGRLDSSPIEDYVNGITESAKAVIQLQLEAEKRGMYLIRPERPDVLLFAPATFRGILDEMKKLKPPAPVLQGLKELERQAGYKLEIDLTRVGEFEHALTLHALLSLRGEELKLQSQVVGLRAASTLATTIRLPPKINRTEGAVSVFARHIRSYDNNPPDKKTSKVFKAVQQALLDSIPKDHLDLIRQSRSGIKIVGNAPLEWLPINGLPLGVWTDVTRINVTPGNAMIEQLESVPPIPIHPEKFKEYLVLSMFEDNDNLAHHLEQALTVLAKEKQLRGKRETPDSVEKFVDAINSYHGSVLIIDSHGTHPESPDVGSLIIAGKPVDIWQLKNKIKVPPIVILSACDTHPFDRSHATVANGFLHCGATAVLSTVLPIRSRQAAIFVMRLMLRAVQYGSDQTKKGLTVSWTNIVGGALRMQLAFDIVTGLERRKMLSMDKAKEIQYEANIDINFPPRPDWLERLGQRCRETGGFDETKWQAIFDDILAGSDVIRYVNLGNPESIILFDPEGMRNAFRKK